jgi:predicted RNase H-like HicB family nuclease
VVVEQDEDGLYIVSVPLLQGCYTQRETNEEALENIKDAIKFNIEARRDLGEPVPMADGQQCRYIKVKIQEKVF